MNETIRQLSFALGQKLASLNCSVSVAESCTGGGIGYAITETPGSSRWFQRGFITYSNEAKSELLGIPIDSIDAHGAVSQQTVEAMALGARERAGADYAVAVSGVAGPEGGSPMKPVGTVWLAWALPGGRVESEKKCFDGDRESVRLQTIELALSHLIANC